MNTFQFLLHLRSLNVKLMRDGDRLQCDAPKGVLTPQIQAQISEYKAEILTLLHQNTDFEIKRIAPETEDIPLSFAQERLWFLNQLEGASATYNVPAALGLTGDLNLDAFDRSLTEIIRRHESLRTSFTTVNGQPVQMIHSSVSMGIEVIDLQHLSDNDRKLELEQHIQKSALTPFDLDIAPLIRCSLLQLAETEYVLCINMHHIVSDGWSIGVLVRELSALYSAYCAGASSPLPELEIQYADFALWQRQYLSGAVLEQQLEYWGSQLQGAPELLQLPTDRPRPSVQTYQGTTQSFTLSLALTQRLQALSRQTGSTLFMTLMAAFATLLYRYSGQSDVVIGSPIANRNRSEIEPLIGFFVNTLVLRTDLQHNSSFIELLHRVQQVTLDAYAHQDVPFEKLVETLQPERNQSYSPLFQVGFVLQNTPAESLEVPGLTLTPLEIESTTVKYDLTLSIEETEHGLISAWEYNSDLFDLTTITRMAGNFQTLLTGIVANPQQKISELPLLNKDEQQQLLWDWNDTEAEYASDLCIHQLFAAQAASTPQAIALAFQERKLTYQELNNRANQLAHYLQKMGVGAETLVGICIDRSPDMLIGLWGILKAGGAYVPLDASYPPERLAYMLSDAEIKVLLTTKNLEAGLPAHAAEVVCLDTDWEEIATESEENPVSNVQPQSLAYVIYTSGSTGTPKGVMVPHRGLCNLAQAQIKLFDVQPTSKVLQFASSSFDASISEIVMTQCTGATLYLDRKEALLPGDTLSDYLQDREITHVTLPPTALAVMPLVPLPQLQTIIVAGEACPQELTARWATGRNFFNAYGPTEGTVCATVSEPLDGSKPAPIGKPIPNVRVYILDDRLQPLPVGVPGELHIAGVGIARGYLNRPDLTAEKFISNPYDNEPYERLYKTGDRARYLPDGNIEFLGRIDHQVKLRGYRIELGEIESLLSKHSQVREAVVVGREDRSGDRRLVAYVVPQENLTALSEQEHPQSDRIELWPSVAEYYVYDDLLYYAMTNDRRRNDSYKVAIERLVVDKIVVEIGTGKDAILARFCAEAGAKKVYAIERNEQTCQQANACIQELGLSDKIVVIHGDATLVELPELADVCVSEIVGAIGGCEGAAVIINNSRRLLKPDGVMIPDRSITKVAAVTLPDEILHNPHFMPTSGHYTKKIFEQVGYPFDLRVCIKKFPHANVLSNADVFEDLDFNRPVDPNFSRKIELTIHQSGRLDGFLVWLNLQTITGEEIDILKHEHCWLPVYFPVFEPGIEVDDGDVIQAVCSRSLCDNHLNPDYAIVGQLIRNNGQVIDFEHISYHYQEVFQRTPFYQKLFSDFDSGEVNPPDTLTNSLRGYLQEILPNYMIPAAFVELENFPLTPNGKVDRKALPAPDGEIERTQEYVAPQNPNQEIITQTFATVLGIEKVSIHDNFFELGGHSLLATQLTSRLKHSFTVDIPLRAVFEAPSVAQLDLTITQLRTQEQGWSRPAIERSAPGSESIPLSFAQERLWFLNQLEGASATYNMPAALRLTGDLNLDAFHQALTEIIRRHEALRTSFTTVNGTPMQVIHPSAEMKLEVIDLQHRGANDRESMVAQQVQQAALAHFDLECPPLIRGSLLQLAETEYVFCINMHHIVSDGWSIGVLVRELSALYLAYCAGASSPLPELEIQYADFALWQRQYLSGEVLEQQLQYWVSQLQGAPELLQLPTDRPRPSVQTYRGATHSFTLNLALTQQLQALSRQTGSTLFMTLMAAFATLLYRYSGQSNVVIGSPIANRHRSEIEQLIGFFVNTLVLRTRLEADLSFEQLLIQVRENTLTAYEHQDVPFEQVVEALQPQRSMSHSPLFQVMFVLQNVPLGEIELSGLTLNELNAQSTIAKFDLTLSMGETPLGLGGEWEYNTDLFDKSTIERMASHFENLLSAIVANPRQAVSELPLLSATERQQLLVEWNDTQTDYPQDKCIHQLFEEQVAKTPDAIAVVFEREELTYQQLNHRANQLAHHLQTLGVKPEVLVGICVERSLEMVVGLLGILKAGGAYVPLDPSYPAERLSYMVSDAGVQVLLTQENLLSVLPDFAQMVCLDKNWETIEQHCQDNLMTDISVENLAYVIYTSGSTGEPKGVCVAHREVNRLIINTNYINLQEQDVVGLASNFSFDAVTFEIWGALVHGAKLVGIERDVMLSPHQLANSLQSQKISTLFVTTALFNQIANVVPSAFNSLQHLMFGGEAVDVSAIKAVLKHQPPQRLLHVYGPTESTTFSTWYLVSDVLEEAKTIPIGRPIANTQVYILDPQLQPVPIGVAGELHIGGDGLARGYLNRPELTQAKFVPHPFSPDSLARLYKTGDLARYLADGNIEFLGRLDYQVKIRGFRIELGEIEAVLSNHPHVRQAVTIATEEPNGNQRLVAYVVSEEETLSTQQLREFLHQQLPAYMVPSTFIILDTLPLTPNGKVDRKALPATDGEIDRSRKHVAPRTEIEQILANIWQELLLVERVSIHDNFFELGGHSLLAVQLVSQIEKQFSLHLPLATLFQSSTIEQLAIFISSDPATGKLWSPLVPIQPKGSLPPFFCVAGAGGNVMYFHELSQYLGKDRPFYGLQAQGLDGETPPLESVEEIASQYIEAIETVQPVGPYFLGGHSFGGKVAFEMAQQLQRKGQVVYLTILDTTAPVSQPDRQDDRSNWDSAQWISVAAEIVEELVGENLAISYEDISALTPDEQFSYFKQQLEMIGFLPPQTDIKLVRGLLQVYRVQSQTDYVPLNTVPIPITLFRSQDIGSEEENYTNFEHEDSSNLAKDPAWGWNQFSDGVVDIHTVPGTHLSMMTKPHVQVLAQHLQKSLDKAQKHQLETPNAKTTEK